MTKISIIGGDLRIVKLAEMLLSDGFELYTYGLELADSIEKNEAIIKCQTIEEVVEKSSIIISSIPLSSNEEKVNMPFSEQELTVEELIKHIEGKIFIAGRIKEEIYNKVTNAKIIDVLKREELTVLNTISTAEGAIQIAMEETTKTLHGSNILIMGFGRVSKILSNMLKGIGANVYCETTKVVNCSWIKAYGYKPVLLSELKDCLGKFDVIINGKKSDFTETEKDLENCESIVVSVPRRRGDISIKEDLIEEVGRIYGVDNIVGKLPEMPMKAGSYDTVTRGIRNKMIDLGLNETLSYILVNDKEAKYFTKDDTELVKLLDPMTEERNTLRHSILPSLLKIYQYNKARNNKDVSVFEIGKAFYKKGEEYGETNKLAALMTGDFYLGVDSKKQVDFYIIKGIAEELLDYLGYGNRYSFVIRENQMPDEVHPGQAALISVNNDIVGLIGRVHPALEKDAVYVMEIDLDKLLSKKVGKMKYKEISKFPSVKKDLAVVVDKNITSEEIAAVIKKAGGSSLSKIEVFDVYTGKGIEENKKSIAYSLTFEKMDRTLTDEEINEYLEKIIDMVSKKIGAELRK